MTYRKVLEKLLTLTDEQLEMEWRAVQFMGRDDEEWLHIEEIDYVDELNPNLPVFIID